MKIAISAFLIGSLLLVGCSDSGSGGGSAFPPEFNPQTIPSNPAPKAYLQSLVAKLDGNARYLPGEAAYFSAILDSSDVKNIWEGSPERKEAKEKLNNEGLRFLDQIKSNCNIQNARVSKSGKSEKSGDVLTVAGSMATSGAKCPYVVNVKKDSTTNYDLIDINQISRTVRVAARMSSSDYNSRQIRDPRIQALSGIVSVEMELKTTANVNMTSVYHQNGSKNESGSMDLTGNGFVKVTLADGDVIQGPLSVKAIATNGNSEMRFLFDGATPQGAVRVVAIAKKDGQGEVYVNGEKVDLSSFKIIAPKGH